ncbi:MAG: phosphate ABC transporter permease subunit PstC [Sulfolobales archaeon]|nr:phosphate ABC transporter permease subunit PstC [Sulfolobales archaeon]MDW7969308.1 phosphate ABC transporter permease subunit PstC [Sulfolobales archaeon]
MKSKRFLVHKYDRNFFLALLPTAFIIIGLLIITFSLISNKAVDAFESYGFNLYLMNIWDPEKERYGLLAPLIGTLMTSIIATLTALILSLSLSITISEYLKGVLKNALSITIEFMSGLPTVIYSLWGIQYAVPILRDHLMLPLYNHFQFIPLFSCRPLSGFSVLSAGLVIGISIIPYLTALIHESYSLIPIAYREACLGIGATRYETIRILLGLCKPAVIAAVILGLARAMGETTIAAALVGNSMTTSACLFTPSYTVSALIASQYANAQLYRYAEPVLYSAALAILIIALTLSLIGLNMLSKWRVKILA